MNGNFVQDVERNRIVIEAALGSIIEVTDSGPPTKLEASGPARLDGEEFHFHETSEETDVDLERSRSGTTADLSYEAYAKVSLKKYRPIAARNEDEKVFSGLL